MSRGKRFKINACPSKSMQQPCDDEDDEIDRDWNGRHRVCVAAAKASGKWIKGEPGSEPEIVEETSENESDQDAEENAEGGEESETLDDEDDVNKDYPPVSKGKVEPPTPAQQSRDSDDEDEEDRNWEVNASEDEEDTCEEDTDAKTRAEDSNEGSEDEWDAYERPVKPTKFQITSKIQENYIKIIQKGASNEEWNAFCEAEKNRLRKNKRRWKLLNEDTDNETDESSDGNERRPRYPTPTLEPPDPLERSQTLVTQDSEPVPHGRRTKGPNLKNARHQSKIVSTRRTRRIRRQTERAKALGAKGNLPSGYIVSLLWVLKQFAWLIPSR